MAGVAMALSGCATRGGPVAYATDPLAKPDIPTDIAPSNDYHLGPADVLNVSVYGVSEFSGDYTVDSVGRIKLPLVGDVAVQGQTSDQVATVLTQKLQATYLRDPKVQVVLKTAQSQRITVDGSVAQPGLYAIGADTTLIQAIATAKGVTDDGNPRRVVIFRKIAGVRQAAAFDLTDIRRGKAPDPQVYSNDIIVVDGNGASKAFKNVVQALPIAALFRPF
jgi:polysaccharide export outer membrane protein